MKRRAFFAGAAGAGLAAAAPAVLAAAPPGLTEAAPAEPPKNAIFNLQFFYMRNGSQVERTTHYLGNVFLPAAKRAGLVSGGFFSPVIGEQGPYILSIAGFPSFAALDSMHSRFGEDKEFQKGWDEYNNIAEPPYIRTENVLLRAFDGMPALEIPPTEGRRAARIFELRTYESVNEKASLRKIKMFNDGEIGIFKRLGMAPVFFGQTLSGRNMPSLTYMLGFDDLAAREKLWRAFGSDPEWQKLRSQPGLSDAEIVSNISSRILRPLPFSPVR